MSIDLKTLQSDNSELLTIESPSKIEYKPQDEWYFSPECQVLSYGRPGHYHTIHCTNVYKGQKYAVCVWSMEKVGMCLKCQNVSV